MNKFNIVLLLGTLLIVGSLSAQNLQYDFEQCNVGDKVAETLGDPWTTWNSNPGGAEDAIVTDEHCIGTRAIKIDNGNDLVLKLGDKTSGTYNISFDMYVPEGKEGYFNVLHEFAGPNSVWAIQGWFNSQEYGNYLTPVGFSFDIPIGEWFNIDIDIYLEDVLASIKIDGTSVATINYSNYSTAKYCSIAAMDFFPCSSDPDRNGYYIDNVKFTEIPGPYYFQIVPDHNNLEAIMQPDQLDTLNLNFDNQGNRIGYFYEWIDYGMGDEDGDEKNLHRDGEPYNVYGNFNDNPYIEIGTRFMPENMTESNVMGMKVAKMQYYVPVTAQEGWEGPLTFKVYTGFSIYSRSMDTLMAEKTLDEYSYGAWNTVEFDTPIPLRGYPILATVGFQQANGGYPISLDAGPSDPMYTDLVRLNGGSWFSLRYDAYHDWGSHNIRLVCEGSPVVSEWVKETLRPQSVLYYYYPDEIIPASFAFNSNGLDYGSYEATYKLFTANTYDNIEVSIPLKLIVSGAGADENGALPIAVYPSPTNGQVKIEAEGLKQITVSNVLGQVIYEGKAEGDVFEYNFSNNESGVYLIRIESANGIAVKKVTVTR